MKTQKFGIEIELTGITRETAAAIIAEYFGTESCYAGTYYETYESTDRKGRIWKATYDSSIMAKKKVQGIIRQLRHKGAFASEKCGIHIHVDASRYTPQTLRNMVNIIASKKRLTVRWQRLWPLTGQSGMEEKGVQVYMTNEAFWCFNLRILMLYLMKINRLLWG